MTNLAFSEPSPYVNKRLTDHSNIMEQKIYKTGENVYTAVGFGLSYPVMIEGEDGIIIIDPGETVEMMESILTEFRKITDKPVKAVIISHSHGDHWGGMSTCVTKEQSERKEVLVIVDETFLPHFTQQSGELLDIRMGRAVWMYGSILPRGEHGYVNLGCGPVLSKGSIEFITPNTFVPIQGGLHTTISGIDLELFHCEAETEDAMCVFLPKEKIMFVGDAVQGEIFPNLYSIRGSVRDAKKWYRGIDEIRRYEPDNLIGTHMRPLHGKEACTALLRDYRDAIQYTHDQTVRMINAGYTPDAAVEELDILPPHLFQRERLGEFYGTFSQGIRGVYNQYIGWFDGEPTALAPVPLVQAAKKYVALMGGREAILEAARKSAEAGEFQWAAEILTYLIRVDHGDMDARKIKAEALRKLGYRTENATWRNWYLTGADALEGTFHQIQEQFGKNGGFPPFSNSFLGLTPQAMFASIQVKLNGPQSAYVNMIIKADVTDKKECFYLEVRNGILDIYTDQDVKNAVNISIAAPHAIWANIITKEMTVREAVLQEKAVCHELEKAEVFFELFEGFTSFVDMPFWFQ